MDSNQGYNPYKWVICPLTRLINLHITSYIPYPEPLSRRFFYRPVGIGKQRFFFLRAVRQIELPRMGGLGIILQLV